MIINDFTIKNVTYITVLANRLQCIIQKTTKIPCKQADSFILNLKGEDDWWSKHGQRLAYTPKESYWCNCLSMTLNLLFLFLLFLDNLFVLVHFFLCVCGGWATRSQSLTLVLRLIIGLGADPCICKVCTIILCLLKIIKWINTCNNLNSLLCSIINMDRKHLFDTPTP